MLEGKWVSLQAFADYFKLKYKKTSGREIPELWEAGDYGSIKKHCLIDVQPTAQLFDRLKPLLFEPATAKQKDYMRSLGISFSEDVTKWEASRLIDEAKKREA